jgi:hypothetical protein
MQDPCNCPQDVQQELSDKRGTVLQAWNHPQPPSVLYCAAPTTQLAHLKQHSTLHLAMHSGLTLKPEPASTVSADGMYLFALVLCTHQPDDG